MSMRVCVCVCVCVCAHVCVCVCVCVCMHGCVCACVCVHVSLCVYIYVLLQDYGLLISFNPDSYSQFNIILQERGGCEGQSCN